MFRNIPRGNPLDPNMGVQPPAAPAIPIVHPPGVQIAHSVNPGPAPSLPKAPPAGSRRPKINMFDDEHRQETLLAIAMGMLSGQTFGEGMGATAQNLLKLRGDFREDAKPVLPELGGPDDAFEVYRDERTGEVSYKPVPAFQSYLTAKDERKNKPDAPDPKDIIAARGATMGAILRLPAELRPQALADFSADFTRMGWDLGLPSTWDDNVGAAMRDQAISPKDYMAAEDRDEAFELRRENVKSTIANRERASVRADRRLNAPPSTRKGGMGAKLPTGFILD